MTKEKFVDIFAIFFNQYLGMKKEEKPKNAIISGLSLLAQLDPNADLEIAGLFDGTVAIRGINEEMIMERITEDEIRFLARSGIVYDMCNGFNIF